MYTNSSRSYLKMASGTPRRTNGTPWRTGGTPTAEYSIPKRRPPRPHGPGRESIISQRIQDSRTLRDETHEKMYMAI